MEDNKICGNCGAHWKEHAQWTDACPQPDQRLGFSDTRFVSKAKSAPSVPYDDGLRARLKDPEFAFKLVETMAKDYEALRQSTQPDYQDDECPQCGTQFTSCRTCGWRAEPTRQASEKDGK